MRKLKNMKNTTITLCLIIGTALVLFVATFAFTRPSPWKELDFSRTGQIGDTIGGITAPLVGIIGALLVYFSFREQVKANRIQTINLRQENRRNTETQEFNTLLDLYKQVKDDLEGLVFVSSKAKVAKPIKGRRAINAFVKALSDLYNDKSFLSNAFFRDYLFILSVLSMLTQRVQTSMLNNKDKSLLLTLISYLYATKLSTYNDRIIKAAKAHKVKLRFVKYVQKVHSDLTSISDLLRDAKGVP